MVSPVPLFSSVRPWVRCRHRFGEYSGVAQVRQFLVAKRRAYRVEILDHVGGSDVGQKLLAHLVYAALDEILGLLLDVRHPGR
jgi:hypothetical protein